jgi:hypothetical protein
MSHRTSGATELARHWDRVTNFSCKGRRRPFLSANPMIRDKLHNIAATLRLIPRLEDGYINCYARPRVFQAAAGCYFGAER